MKRLFIVLALLASPVYADNVLDIQTNIYGTSLTKPGLYVGRARGTSRDPEQLFNSDFMHGIYANGFKPNGFTSTPVAAVSLMANENWSNTANGTKIIFTATPNTTTTPTTAFSITGTSVSVNVSLFTMPISTGPRTNVTPSIAGQVIFNSTFAELCMSTGTAINSWVKVSTPTLACEQ